jgi:ABC-type branched-subunit amino acid transport system substrate-binding protein
MTTPSSRGRTKTLAIGALSAATVLTLATSSATAAPSPAPKVTTTASCAPVDGVTSSSIKFAIIQSLTGANAANFKGFNEAVKLRFDQENAKGGIFGRKLTSVVIDDASNGTTQVTAASKAIEGEKAFAVIQETTQDTMMGYLNTNNIPTIGINNGAAGYKQLNNFGAAGTGNLDYVSTSAPTRLKAAGASKVATITFPVPAAINTANSFKATLAGTGITEVLRIADAPFGAYDATSTALKIKTSGADSAYLILLVDGGVSVMNALKQQGISLKVPYMAGLSDPAVIKAAGTGLNGVLGATYGTTPATPVTMAARSGVRTYVKGMSAAGLNPYGASPPLGYVSADTFIKGLKATGKCPTRQGLITALRSSKKGFDGGGMLPVAVSYAPTAQFPFGQPPRCTWFITAQDGQVVADKEPTCGQLMEVATGKLVG